MDDVRLIDAFPIIEKLKRYYNALSPDIQSELVRRDEVSSCIAELINAPTVDVSQVQMDRKKALREITRIKNMICIIYATRGTLLLSDCQSIELSLSIIKDQICKAEVARRGKWIAVTSYDAFGGDVVQWEIHGNPIAYHYCSECKNQCDVDENGDEILSDFCPICGADMRGDEDVDESNG